MPLIVAAPPEIWPGSVGLPASSRAIFHRFTRATVLAAHFAHSFFPGLAVLVPQFAQKPDATFEALQDRRNAAIFRAQGAQRARSG